MLLALLLPALVIGLLAARAFRRPTDGEVGDWAGAHALLVTPMNRPLVERYLRVGRELRTLGGLGGLVLPYLVAGAAGVRMPSTWPSWGWVFLGYLLGAFYAEVSLARPTPNQRAASLSIRRLRDYLPARLRVAPVLVAIIAVVAAALSMSQDTDALLDRGGVLTLTAVVLVVAAGVRLLQRHVIQRGQPLQHPDLVAADDAIRASSVHLLAGSGLAAQFLVTSELLFNYGSSGHPGGTAVDIGGLAFAIGSLFAWMYYGHRAWRVQRAPMATGVAA